jgi:uncharacterized protein (TIGR02145 family)
MKNLRLLITIFFLTTSYTLKAQVAINEDNSSPEPSAMLDVKSEDKGFLTPRMTTTQIAGISDPAAGLLVFNTDDNRFYFYDEGDSEWKEMPIGIGTISPTPAVPVITNPITGEIWMDRNLGATQKASANPDAEEFGDLYQWGRLTDGHESRESGTTTSLSGSDEPGHSDYIICATYPNDWRSPQNSSLWQGEAGTNNPCPSGFRIPTEAEWNAERQSWSSNNAAGAYSSLLHLSAGGYRYYEYGTFGGVGTSGNYWSSTTTGDGVMILTFGSSYASVSEGRRGNAASVRCIKD